MKKPREIGTQYGNQKYFDPLSEILGKIEWEKDDVRLHSTTLNWTEKCNVPWWFNFVHSFPSFPIKLQFSPIFLGISWASISIPTIVLSTHFTELPSLVKTFDVEALLEYFGYWFLFTWVKYLNGIYHFINKTLLNLNYIVSLIFQQQTSFNFLWNCK